MIILPLLQGLYSFRQAPFYIIPRSIHTLDLTSTHHSRQLQLRNSSSSGSRGGCTSSPCWFITNHSFANWDWSSFVAAYWRQMKITHLSHKIEPTEMMFGCLNEFGSVLVGWFGESMRIGESCDTSFILPLKLTKRYINRYLHIIFYIFIHPLHRNPFGTNNILQSFFIYHFPTAPWSGFQLPTNPPPVKNKKIFISSISTWWKFQPQTPQTPEEEVDWLNHQTTKLRRDRCFDLDSSTFPERAQSFVW